MIRNKSRKGRAIDSVSDEEAESIYRCLDFYFCSLLTLTGPKISGSTQNSGAKILRLNTVKIIWFVVMGIELIKKRHVTEHENFIHSFSTYS